MKNDESFIDPKGDERLQLNKILRDLKNRIAILENSITNMDINLSTITGQLKDHMTNTANLWPKIAILEEKVDILSASFEGHQGAHINSSDPLSNRALSTMVTTLEAQVSSIMERISVGPKDVLGWNTRIERLDEEVTNLKNLIASLHSNELETRKLALDLEKKIVEINESETIQDQTLTGWRMTDVWPAIPDGLDVKTGVHRMGKAGHIILRRVDPIPGKINLLKIYTIDYREFK
jgi:chromosome segregation ATPase